MFSLAQVDEWVYLFVFPHETNLFLWAKRESNQNQMSCSESQNLSHTKIGAFLPKIPIRVNI